MHGQPHIRFVKFCLLNVLCFIMKLHILPSFWFSLFIFVKAINVISIVSFSAYLVLLLPFCPCALPLLWLKCLQFRLIYSLYCIPSIFLFFIFLFLNLTALVSRALRQSRSPANSPGLAAFRISCESESSCIIFLHTTLKADVEIISSGSQTRVASNKSDAHYTSDLC